MEGEVIPGPPGMPRIDFEDVHVYGQRPSERSSINTSANIADTTVSTPNLAATSQNTSVEVITVNDPLQIVLPKTQAERGTVATPENVDQRLIELPPAYITGNTPGDRADRVTPQKEMKTFESDVNAERQNWIDKPLDDHTEAGLLPSFVFPNKPSNNRPKRKRRPLLNKTSETGVAQLPGTAYSDRGQVTVNLGGINGEITEETIQHWVDAEEVPGELRRNLPFDFDDYSPEHVSKVIAIINYHLKEQDNFKDQSSLTKVERAFYRVHELRRKNAHSSQSILLRDADRYLFARAWEKVGFGPFPMGSAVFYGLFKKVPGFKWLAKADRDLPSSIQGAIVWSFQGVRDAEFDKGGRSNVKLANENRFYGVLDDTRPGS